ncbi:MAG: KEOPS complex subunit Pcc1 [Candidatus Methanomethylophilaceae archaeon]|jgi:tRNA threonylcarbamoyladenosine modification (KEOPS) complex  Pcc1 subunit
MNTLDLRVEYESPETAAAVAAALDPDNGTYVDMEVLENVINFKMEAMSASSLRNTADDLLACLKIAEEASGLVGGPAADLDGDSSSE